MSSFVKNLPRVWGIYRLCQVYHCRPSELLHIDDSYTAFCLDEAIGVFGLGVENELNSVEAKTEKEAARKRQQLLGKLLQLPDEQRFRKFSKPRKK